MNRQHAAMARTSLDRRTILLRDTATMAPPSGGWIRSVREALGMSATQFAQRLGVARQTAQEQEQSEIDGSIGVMNLRRAAEALDCQLIYAFVPKTSLEDLVRTQARRVASAELSRVDQTMLLEGQRVDQPEADERLLERIEELIGSRQLWNLAPHAKP